MKKLRLLACTAALILIATSVFEVTVDESGITTNNRGGRRLALRDHVLGEMQCKCITSEQAAAAICNQYVYPDESDYCNYERECVWDDENYACVTKSAFCGGEDN
jgi:hypothetical protein